MHVRAEARRLDPLSGGVADVGRDDEDVDRVLAQELVGLDVQRVGRHFPRDLVDPGDLEVGHAEQEDVRAVDARRIDRAGERDRDPRLHVEAVERVEDVDVGAVGRAHGAVRLRQLHAKTGVLRPVERRPAITGERAALGARQVEARLNTRCVCQRRQCKDCEEHEEREKQRSAGRGHQSLPSLSMSRRARLPRRLPSKLCGQTTSGSLPRERSNQSDQLPS